MVSLNAHQMESFAFGQVQGTLDGVWNGVQLLAFILRNAREEGRRQRETHLVGLS